MVVAGAFGFPILSTIGMSTLLHVILEIQEFYGDVLLHTHNVRDTQDSMNDLLFGVLGVIVYGLIRSRWTALRDKRPKRLRRTTKDHAPAARLLDLQDDRRVAPEAL